MIDYEALFSDGTEMFCTPMEADPGESVTIRFRAAQNNTDRIVLCTGSEEREMFFEYSRNGFSYYRTEIVLGNEPFYYWFLIWQGDESCCYTKTGISADVKQEHCFSLFPGFHTPDWAKGAVMYQIYTDRFCNGDPSNDVMNGEYLYLGEMVRHADDWYRLPDGHIDVGNFYGGDLQGVLDKLDYLQDLGIEVIYFNPLFVSPSNHKYDTQDYDHIDPHYGKIVTNLTKSTPKSFTDNREAFGYIERTTRQENLEASDALFIRLIEEAHMRGIRVILDGVFNHCGSFHKWMDFERIYEKQPGYPKGAYVSETSPYRDFFCFKEGSTWPYNEQYEGWWDHKTLPKLNYEGSHRLQEEILRIGRKWVSPPYNADGWRLDVAADLGHSLEFNHHFWKRFRTAVRSANPDALILAEHYGDARPWMNGEQWDSVMNYDAFMEPITWFLTGMEKHSDYYQEESFGDAELFAQTMTEQMTVFSEPSLLTTMNQLDNHDHSRFLTRTNHVAGRVEHLGTEAAETNVDSAVLREAVVMQMTWPGAPTLYYGDEAGVCGFTDPDSRRPYPWGREDTELLQFYREAIALHKQYPVLRNGSFCMLYCDIHVLGYARFYENEQIFVFVNNREASYELEASVRMAGIAWEEQTTLTMIFSSKKQMKQDKNSETGRMLYSAKTSVSAGDGMIRMTLPKQCAVVLYHADGQPAEKTY